MRPRDGPFSGEDIRIPKDDGIASSIQNSEYLKGFGSHGCSLRTGYSYREQCRSTGVVETSTKALSRKLLPSSKTGHYDSNETSSGEDDQNIVNLVGQFAKIGLLYISPK